MLDATSTPSTGFRAGNTKYHFDAWTQITSDRWILDTVRGYKIDFEEVPKQTRIPKLIQFSEHETELIQSEIDNFLAKGIIRECEHEAGEFVSNIFIRPKKNGKIRVVLNLKSLNRMVVYQKFKMDTVHSVCTLIKRDCYLASLDLQDAYYSVPVHPESQKYLKFYWRNKLYCYQCLPNGLSSAPRVFVKLLKPVFAVLRKQGHISSVYIDDVFLVGNNMPLCQRNVHDTKLLLAELGFCIHEIKSVEVPVRIPPHLGYIFNSTHMTVTLTREKVNKRKTVTSQLLGQESCTIRQVAEVVGILVSNTVGAEFGSLHYKSLETDKSRALRHSCGNFDATMTLSDNGRQDLQWWLQNAETCYRSLDHGPITVTLVTDASHEGWGGVRVQDGTSVGTNGRWSESEQNLHINSLEMLAIYHSLQALCSEDDNTHIICKTDNKTALAYVRNMGGCRSTRCNAVAQKIWNWCASKNIWITITHIAGGRQH